MQHEGKKPTRRTFIKTTSAVTGLGALAGCLSGPDGGGDGDSGSGGSSDELFKVGHLGIMSGPVAENGRQSSRGIELAAKDLNAEGGINGKNVQVIIRDTQGDPDRGVEMARDLVQNEDVDIIIENAGSAVARAVGEYTTQEQVIHFRGGLGNELLSDCSDYGFRVAGNNSAIQRALAQSASEEMDGAKVAAIVPDYSFGRNSWNFFKEKLSELNSNVEVVNENFPQLAKGQYGQEIQSILASEPDLVYSSLWAAVPFFEQANERGFFDQIPIFASGSGIILSYTRALGGDCPDFMASTGYYYKMKNEVNNRWVSSYRKSYNAAPTFTSEIPASGLLAVNAAASETGSTATDDLIDGLEGLEYDSPAGPVKIRSSDHEGVRANIVSGWIESVDYADFKGYREPMPTVSGEDIISASIC